MEGRFLQELPTVVANTQNLHIGFRYKIQRSRGKGEFTRFDSNAVNI